MTRRPSVGEIEAFKRHLEGFYRDNRNLLVSRFRSMAEASEIISALHLVLAESLDRFIRGQPAPENLGGFVHTAVRRRLIDLLRREFKGDETHPLPVEEVESLSKFLNRPLTPEESINIASWKHDEGPRTIDIEDVDESFSKFLNRPLIPEENIDILAWKQLFRIIFARLPLKWRKVAEMAMVGASPEEIGSAFGQNGYVLRRYARQLICRILGELAGGGDDLAGGLAHDFCRGAA